MPFWVIMQDGREGCATRSGLDAVKDKQTNESFEEWIERNLQGKIQEYWTIPECARPLILGKDWFLCCSDPKGKCKGKHSCPNTYRACND